MDGNYYKLNQSENDYISYYLIEKVNDECMNIEEEFEAGDTKRSIT